MKRLFISMMCLLLCLTAFTGCVNGSQNANTDNVIEEVEPTPPPYLPNYLTGEEQSADYNANSRVVAVMVNNIVFCRPQRGISDADVLMESKVEGGITRFMALFQDYTKVDGDIGPVRSGRDQFLRIAMPMDAIYMHIGRSGVTQTYIDTYEYNSKDVDGMHKSFTERDQKRINQGYALEHTAFTNPDRMTSLFEKYDYDTVKKYSGTWLDFVNYNEVEGGIRELGGESATSVSIVHSNSYRTYFDYDDATGKYFMSQYNYRNKAVEDTIDENNGVHLNFENLLVLFADIEPYPYPGGNLDANGNDKGDPDYQRVDMDYGCVGYYFSNGEMVKVRWFKGGAPDMLRITDMDENPLPLNCGKTYITFVDLDEFENFSYAGAEEELVETEIIEEEVSGEETGD